MTDRDAVGSGRIYRWLRSDRAGTFTALMDRDLTGLPVERAATKHSWEGVL